MWLLLAFASAFFLGCYDISKKMSVNGNAIVPVLFLNILFCTLLLSPMFILSRFSPSILEGTAFYMPQIPFEAHGHILLKSAIVSTAWFLGLTAMKHLPLTITGPINAGRPVITLVGAFFIFGERLNTYQWIGVLLTILSFYLLSRSGKKEGINFTSNKWIICVVFAAILGAISGLYDKFLMQHFAAPAVQFWYNLYSCILMLIVLLAVWYPKRAKGTSFQWRWSILFIAIFLTIADFLYFYALTYPDAMVSVISTARRSSVLISFAGGVLLFNEKNLKGKVVDLGLILLAMFFLYLGTK